MSDIQQKGVDEVYCSSCGAIIKKEAEICPKCGVRQRPVSVSSRKNGLDYFADVMKKYAVIFIGRARRAELWWFVLCVCIIQILATIPGIISSLLFYSSNYLLANFVSMVLLVPSISVWWRRMHDVGKPGGYCFIPIYNIILAVQEGDRGTNQYGPDPKEE
jgi:uncharacterized membrane protein YhaH (DUF805 family)